ncbi:MAG: FxLYD domain-containing protein [Bryobacteraceae bacterium]
MAAGNTLLDSLLKRIEPVRARVELFISGRAPDDPLYLTNRSWQQKARVAAVIAVPVLLLAILFTAAATDLFRFHKIDPFEHPLTEVQAPAAVTLKHVPDPVLSRTDLEVVNIRITKDARQPVVTGTVRNNTDQKVDSAEVSYYLADTEGSLVGTDTTDVANVSAHGSVTFRMPLKVANAQYVIVRDVHPE